MITAAQLRIGDVLVAKGLLTTEQVTEALALQRNWSVRFGDVVMARGWVRAYDFYNALSESRGMPFVNLLRERPHAGMLDHADVESYTRLLTLPWRYEDGVLLLATADPGPEVESFARARYGDAVAFVVTSKFDIIWTTQQVFERELTQSAVHGLQEAAPEMSAHSVFTGPQLTSIYAVLTVVLLALTVWPLNTIIALNILITIFYLINVLLRVTLVWVGSSHRIDMKVTDAEVGQLSDADLPVYTVLVPMFKEAAVLPRLAAGIRALDYPMSKLDVKLVLEADDSETIEAAKQLGLESIFEILRVPASKPQTKPKACNYALHFARGSYLTIYDAEDRPEPDQLKKALVAFAKAPASTACLQARLNYFNRNENWLTRQFTLDYSLWFDFILPGLEKLRIPIPLGGTSNHFRIEVLRELHSWDPFNVTEDADLGVRLTQKGYTCGVINSTTFEEANNDLGNWIRQRSRWIKGYMQTYLVHMRDPIRLYRSLGHVGFWGFQFFIGGSILVVLLNPLMWGLFAAWLIFGIELRAYFPGILLNLCLLNLLIGNAAFTYFNMVGAFKRKYYDLIPYGLTAMFYWWLMSIAAYKGLWQLLHRPFYWEKTHHGLTKIDLDTPAPASAPA